MPATDVESLQPASRPRSRCMDAFLLGSVIFLLVTVLSGGALGFWLFKDLSMKVAHLKNQSEAPPYVQKLTQGRPSSDTTYKAQNFAYLTPINSEVKSSSMLWQPVKYGNASSLGSRYSYDSNHGALKIVQDGTYFLYTQLNVTCTGLCTNGSLRMSFEDSSGMERLSCQLHLTSTASGPLVKNCWTVIPHLTGGSRLMARMLTSVPTEAWRLDLNHSGFGMLLVDGP